LEAFLREAIEARPRRKKRDMMKVEAEPLFPIYGWYKGCNANLRAELHKSGGTLKEE
jgi:hypothetical protein